MTQRSILVALPLLVLAALWGCDNDTSNDVAGPPGGGGTDKTCIGCHSSETELKAALAEFSPLAFNATRFVLASLVMAAFLAAAVVDLFQSAIDKVVLLAVLMPVVPSMGGVAGTQSLVIITRAMALGQVDKTNATRILKKELAVGLLNGLGWSIVVATFTYLWFGDWRIGGVIAAAMIINLFIAAFSGFGIPILLKKMRIDPAIAGGVVLTTVTDVVGYMAFLGLGTALLL